MHALAIELFQSHVTMNHIHVATMKIKLARASRSGVQETKVLCVVFGCSKRSGRSIHSSEMDYKAYL